MWRRSAAAQEISRQTFYKWRKRFEARVEGLRSGLAGRSCPRATPAEVEDASSQRKELAEQGVHNGPESIAVGAASARACRRCRRGRRSRGPDPPRAGTPQPRNGPQSATARFCFGRPNEMLAVGLDRVAAGDGRPVAIAGT